jgi:hypothetical protein
VSPILFLGGIHSLAERGGPNSDEGRDHKVHIYLEYHSICPFVRIRTPHPLSRKRVPAHPRNQRGWGYTLACMVYGGGPNSDDWRKSLALGLLCGQTLWYSRYTVYVHTLWFSQIIVNYNICNTLSIILCRRKEVKL